jgi:inhibitor of KinA sporulation pathway (predicted exonuclease)
LFKTSILLILSLVLEETPGHFKVYFIVIVIVILSNLFISIELEMLDLFISFVEPNEVGSLLLY